MRSEYIWVCEREGKRRQSEKQGRNEKKLKDQSIQWVQKKKIRENGREEIIHEIIQAKGKYSSFIIYCQRKKLWQDFVRNKYVTKNKHKVCKINNNNVFEMHFHLEDSRNCNWCIITFLKRVYQFLTVFSLSHRLFLLVKCRCILLHSATQNRVGEGSVSPVG